MKKICIFAGTSEGRNLAEFLCSQPVEVTACVATEYGESLITPSDNLKIHAGRLPVGDIKKLLVSEGFDLVIDATHPYAASITDSIIAACSECNVKSVRLLRRASDAGQMVVCAKDAGEAVRILSESEGNILLTTGSKELKEYSAITGFTERVYARVLPMEASLELCREAGVKTSHIIAMQGPFSREMNSAMLKAVNAEWMVTKDGGNPGGFEDKIHAAEETGTKVLLIGRPVEREGISYADTIKLLCSEYGCSRRPEVTIVGIGPGSREAMTGEVKRAIENADCLIGASRMTDAVKGWKQQSFNAIAPGDIASIIREHEEYDAFTVVMSGDSGFFSGTKKLLDHLEGCQVTVLPGLSSMSVLCSRLKTSYEDVKAFSLHGRDLDIVPEVKAHGRVFTLVGGHDGINRLCRDLTDAGLGKARVSLGEKLSYPDEKITTACAEELLDGSFESLSAALIEWDEALVRVPSEDKSNIDNKVNEVVTHGLPDSSFQRGEGSDGVVPMTKREIRALAISMLELKEDSVCWDVGAGTGSVAIEMARQAKKGHVYAVERKADACDLIEINKEKLAASNVDVIKGLAPEALLELPAPTHVFIGGSSGNMKDIISLVLKKNPSARIIATAIALESVAELTSCMKEFPFKEKEVVSISAARNRKAGPYNLMTGQNPVYIFSMSGYDEA